MESNIVGILDEPDYAENQRIRDWLEMKSKDQKIELTGTMMKSECTVTSEEAVCLNGKEVMLALKQLELPSGSIKIWDCPDGYQFVDENGNKINSTKIVLEKKEDKLILESTKKVREYWSEYARIFIEIYDDEPNECVFTHLWVVDGQRRKGYGKQAFMQAEEIAKELGCHIAHLKVETDSWMHKWYLRCGYKWHKNAPDNYTWLTKNLNDVEKKPKYPTTYEECCEMLGIFRVRVYDDEEWRPMVPDFECDLDVRLAKLRELLICRDAYWKIAGDWKPDLEDGEFYFMYYSPCGNIILKDHVTLGIHCNVILAFPSEEMRDAFYEAFKDLIETCKELL